MGLLIFLGLARYAEATTVADNYNSDAIILQNSVSAEQNLPKNQRFAMQPGGYTSKDFGGQVTQLWPNTLVIGRAVKWMSPFLQPNLKLGMDYTYSFTFFLRARDAMGRSPAVPDGWYELELAVVLPDTESVYISAAGLAGRNGPYDRFVTSRSMLVQVSGGTFNRKITLRFPNLTATTVINSLYAELTPLESDCSDSGGIASVHPCIALDENGQPDVRKSQLHRRSNYKPYMLEVPFVPYATSGGGSSSPDDVPASPNAPADSSLAEYIMKAKLYQSAAIRKDSAAVTPFTYAKQNGLNLFSINDPAFVKYTTTFNSIAALEGDGALTITQNDPGFWSQLCTTMFENNKSLIQDLNSPQPTQNPQAVESMIANCAHYPSYVFRISRVTHIYRFDQNAVRFRHPLPLRYSVQSSFMTGRSRSQDSSKTISTLAIPFKVLEAFGIPISALGYSQTVSYSNGASTSISALGSLSLGLDFNVLGASIPALHSQRCLQIFPIAFPNSPFIDKKPGANNGLYLCGPDSEQPITVNESYAHIFMHSGDTSIVDSYSPEVQSANLAIQGDRDVSNFFYQTRVAMVPDAGNPMAPFKVLKSAQSFFASTPSSGSYMVVSPLQFPSENVPSFFQQVLGGYQDPALSGN